MLLSLTILTSFITSLAAKLLADTFLSDRIAIIGNFAGFEHSLNPGIAFGITFPFGLHNAAIPIALLLLLFVAIRSAHTTLSQIGFGLIIGGALGNIVDRLPDGLVTDFFQVSTFPIFNVADSCITVGVAVLLLEMVFNRASSKQTGN